MGTTGTLVTFGAVNAIASVTGVTRTQPVPVTISARCIAVTVVCACRAFIDVFTGLPIARIARPAGAAETTVVVSAGGSSRTVVSVAFAFVNINTSPSCALPARVTLACVATA